MNRKPKIDMLNIVVSYDAITYIFVVKWFCGFCQITRTDMGNVLHWELIFKPLWVDTQ